MNKNTKVVLGVGAAGLMVFLIARGAKAIPPPPSASFFMPSTLNVSAVPNGQYNYDVTFGTTVENRGAAPGSCSLELWSDWETGQFLLEETVGPFTINPGTPYQFSYTFYLMPVELRGFMHCRLVGNWINNNLAVGTW